MPECALSSYPERWTRSGFTGFKIRLQAAFLLGRISEPGWPLRICMYYALLRWFPKRALTRLAGWFADRRRPRWLLQAFIPIYVRVFGIDMSQFVVPPESWLTFNDFFTRELRPGARPLAEGARVLLSPVDGRVIEAGTVAKGRLLQAKGTDYSLSDLLGGDPSWSSYDGGAFCTLYLHPRDYHRIHTPCAGEVVRFRYIPGEFWTVSPAGVRGVPGLFARNERWITFFRTAFGEVAVVKVGATIVGRIRVVYHSGSGHGRHASTMTGALAQAIPLGAGVELGRFELGSTVILLTRPGEAVLDPMQPGDLVKMGAAIGRAVRGS